jgi:hypothetical protein
VRTAIKLQQTYQLIGADSSLVQDREQGLRLQDLTRVDRNHDATWPALMVEDDVASAAAGFAPSSSAKRPEGFVASNPWNSRQVAIG